MYDCHYILFANIIKMKICCVESQSRTKMLYLSSLASLPPQDKICGKWNTEPFWLHNLMYELGWYSAFNNSVVQYFSNAHPIFVGSSVTWKCVIMKGAKGYTIVSDRHSLRIMHDSAARALFDVDRRFLSASLMLQSFSDSSGEVLEEIRNSTSGSSWLASITMAPTSFISYCFASRIYSSLFTVWTAKNKIAREYAMSASVSYRACWRSAAFAVVWHVCTCSCGNMSSTSVQLTSYFLTTVVHWMCLALCFPYAWAWSRSMNKTPFLV